MILIEDLGMHYPTSNSKRKQRFGIYKCVCGNNFRTNTYSVSSGSCKSCGCVGKNKIIERNTVHGLRSHRLYKFWNNMISRVDSDIKYTSRGISVDDNWRNIENFINDMDSTYAEGLTLDRIDVDGNYCKDNCRWTDLFVQAQNKRAIMATNTLGYKGIALDKRRDTYSATIVNNHSRIYIGSFKNKEDAAMAYDKYVVDNKLEHTTNGLYKGK